MNVKTFEEVRQRFLEITFEERFDLIVAAANGGIIPAAMLNQRLNLDMQLLKLHLRDADQKQLYDRPRLLEEIRFEVKGKKILLVEDNETIVMGLSYSLEQEGFEIVSSKTRKDAEKILESETINLVLLDVTLPDGNGFDICKYVKQKLDIPVIFLTAQDEETSVVVGLDLGADDYVIKPFRTRELISRINSVLRRYGKKEDTTNIVQYKNIKIDTNSAKVYKDEKEIIFTSLEYKILLMLFTNQNKLITREQLLEKIWDIAGNFVNDNTLTVYIKRIREKLQDETIIKTVRGLGYRIGD